MSARPAALRRQIVSTGDEAARMEDGGREPKTGDQKPETREQRATGNSRSAGPDLRVKDEGDSLSPFSQECVVFFSEAVQVFGVPKSVGQIYGLLFASPKPLSFSDIVAQLDISKGSASQGLQLLRSLGAIKVAGAPSQIAGFNSKGGSMSSAAAAYRLQRVENATSRREYFEPELGLRRLMSGLLRDRVAPLAAAGTVRLARLRELAKQEESQTSFFVERAMQLQTWRRRLKTALPVLSTLLGPKDGK